MHSGTWSSTYRGERVAVNWVTSNYTKTNWADNAWCSGWMVWVVLQHHLCSQYGIWLTFHGEPIRAVVSGLRRTIRGKQHFGFACLIAAWQSYRWCIALLCLIWDTHYCIVNHSPSLHLLSVISLHLRLLSLPLPSSFYTPINCSRYFVPVLSYKRLFRFSGTVVQWEDVQAPALIQCSNYRVRTRAVSGAERCVCVWVCKTGRGVEGGRCRKSEKCRVAPARMLVERQGNCWLDCFYFKILPHHISPKGTSVSLTWSRFISSPCIQGSSMDFVIPNLWH